jgi:hypothetical protein
MKRAKVVGTKIRTEKRRKDDEAFASSSSENSEILREFNHRCVGVATPVKDRVYTSGSARLQMLGHLNLQDLCTHIFRRQTLLARSCVLGAFGSRCDKN